MTRVVVRPQRRRLSLPALITTPTARRAWRLRLLSREPRLGGRKASLSADDCGERRTDQPTTIQLHTTFEPSGIGAPLRLHVHFVQRLRIYLRRHGKPGSTTVRLSRWVTNARRSHGYTGRWV